MQYRTSYIINYENELIKEYSDLKKTNNEIRNKLIELSKDMPDLYNTLSELKLKEQMEITFNDYSILLDKNLENSINTLLNDYYLLNTKKIREIFEIRKRILKKRNERFGPDNYRAAINVVSEFYNDISIDLMKNKKNFLENYSYSDKSHDEQFLLEFAKPSDIKICRLEEWNMEIKKINKPQFDYYSNNLEELREKGFAKIHLSSFLSDTIDSDLIQCKIEFSLFLDSNEIVDDKTSYSKDEIDAQLNAVYIVTIKKDNETSKEIIEFSKINVEPYIRRDVLEFCNNIGIPVFSLPYRFWDKDDTI